MCNVEWQLEKFKNSICDNFGISFMTESVTWTLFVFIYLDRPMLEDLSELK